MRNAARSPSSLPRSFLGELASSGARGGASAAGGSGWCACACVRSLFGLLLAASVASPPVFAQSRFTTEPVAAPAPRAEREPLTERARQAGLFTFYFENDYFGGTDRFYTSGAKFSWLTADLSSWGERGWRKGVLALLPFVNREGTVKQFGFSLGQQIYTPSDRDRATPAANDRPYAGWSYAEISFIAKNGHRADIVSLQAGMIGPSSRAADTQRIVHEWLNDSVPAGWDAQLRDELGVNFIYERRYRGYGHTLGRTLGLDVIPHGGVSLGNVQTHLNLGATLRLGLNLPSDFGVQLARGGAIGASPNDDHDPRVAADRDLSFFLFGGADGRAVARNIFLDGNTWKERGPSVDKRPFVADLQAGFGLSAGRWQLTGTYVRRTREFRTQPEATSDFGSITLSVAL